MSSIQIYRVLSCLNPRPDLIKLVASVEYDANTPWGNRGITAVAGRKRYLKAQRLVPESDGVVRYFLRYFLRYFRHEQRQKDTRPLHKPTMTKASTPCSSAYKLSMIAGQPGEL